MNIDQEHLGPPMRVDPPQTRGARSCNFVLLQFFRRKTYDLSVYMNRSTLFQSPCPSILTPLSRSSKSMTAATRVGADFKDRAPFAPRPWVVILATALTIAVVV